MRNVNKKYKYITEIKDTRAASSLLRFTAKNDTLFSKQQEGKRNMLESLSHLHEWETVSISPENLTGGKGKGGMTPVEQGT